jgi:hypothetical protein
MRKPIKKIEKRGNQNLIINLVIGIAVLLIFSIVLFDTLKPEKKEQNALKTEQDLNSIPTEIPRKETPKPVKTKQVQNEDYKQYQSYFEHTEDEEGPQPDPQAGIALE